MYASMKIETVFETFLNCIFTANFVMVYHILVFLLILPLISQGATLKQSIVTTSTNNKKKPSPSVIKTMRKHLQLEYEFYEFIKRRFYYLKAELGIVRSRPRRPKADSDKNSK